MSALRTDDAHIGGGVTADRGGIATRVPVLLVVSSLLLVGSVHGQVERLAVGDRVRVTIGTPLSERFVATLEGVQGDTLVLALRGDAVRRVPIDTVERFEVSRGRHRKTWSGAAFGLLAGAGAGALLGVVVSCDDSSDCLRPGEVVPASTLALGVGGGLIGALVGALTEVDRWEEIPVARLRARPPELDGGVEGPPALTADRAGQPGVPSHRQGLWGAVGMGGGWDPTMQRSEDWALGPAAFARVGGSPTPQLLVGGEIAGWRGGAGDSRWVSTNALLTALVYPARRGNLFVKLGMGLATRVDEPPPSLGVSGTTWHAGFGANAGFGYDFPIGRTVALAPALEVLAQTVSGLDLAVLFTVGLTWH